MAHRVLRCSLAAILATAHATDNCALTDGQPTRPRYLKFCQDFSSFACCIPGHDLENQLQFELLIDGLGPGCKNPMMYPMIRYWYCLGCDPDQPKYTSEYVGDEGYDGVIRVCSDFVSRLWDDYQEQYLECGVMQPNECPEDMPDFDPYTCGDDLIIPPRVFASGIEFMQRFAPPGLYDYKFEEVDVEVNGTDNCWRAPFMRSSSAHAARAGMVTVAVVVAGLVMHLVL